jgi:hypothetical protein
MPPNIEMIITRYLYIRQLEMHKDKWEKLWKRLQLYLSLY